MKNFKIWLVILAVFLVIGVGLGMIMGFFGYVIGGFCALLTAILLFKKKAEAQNRDQVVFDEDKIYNKRAIDEDEEDDDEDDND